MPSLLACRFDTHFLSARFGSHVAGFRVFFLCLVKACLRDPQLLPAANERTCKCDPHVGGGPPVVIIIKECDCPAKQGTRLTIVSDIEQEFCLATMHPRLERSHNRIRIRELVQLTFDGPGKIAGFVRTASSYQSTDQQCICAYHSDTIIHAVENPHRIADVTDRSMSSR